MAALFSRKTAALVGVNVGLTIVLLLALELAASLVVSLPRAHMQYSWRLNHHFRPGWSRVEDIWVADNPDFPEPYVHAYNAQGWLEPYDIRRDKPEGTYRVFYLGDSFTAGTVAMDGSVPSLVERALNERGDPGLTVEVINTGTESYSPIIHYVLVRYVLMEYDPDLIIMNVDMTDDLDDWKYQQTAEYDDEGNPLAIPPRDLESSNFIDTGQGLVRQSAASRLHLFLYTRSHLYNGIVDRVGRPQEATGTVVPAEDPGFLYRRWAWCQFEWDDQTAAQAEKTLDWIRRTVAYARDAGVRFMVTAAPHYQQYNGTPDFPLWSPRPHYEIGRVAVEAGAKYLNSYEALEEAVTGTPQSHYYYHRDMHFNPRGYALWADAHIGFLQDPANDLLPPSFLARPSPE